jgi:hypothetical protein
MTMTKTCACELVTGDGSAEGDGLAIGDGEGVGVARGLGLGSTCALGRAHAATREIDNIRAATLVALT